MKVAIVLPRGMKFSPQGATSIDIVAHDLTLASRFHGSTYVVGEAVSEPFADVDFRSVPPGSQTDLAKSFVEVLKGDLPDVIVVHQHPETAARIARKLPDVPVLLHRHGLLKENRGAFSRWRKGRLFAGLAGIVFVSSFIRDSFLAQFPNLASKTSVVFNGVGADVWAPAPSKQQTIVYVGRARQDKGVLPLIEAFRTLSASDWSLKLILGVQTEAETAFFAEIEALVANAKSIALVKNAQSDEVQRHLSEASIAALPSIVREGFPRAVVEAMSCGCAVVATRQGGTPEAAGDAALLLDRPDAPDFTERLTDALDKLTHNPETLQELSARARAHAVSNLSIAAVAAEYDDLLSRTAGL
ncbi:glycosyltransferase family 4 protein [Roseibium sp.]|uniref:glycosyltransferase family 4 protein n=1 Tax=Roseibium sp. TaxID=1936156 RepID=UPI003A972C17